MIQPRAQHLLIVEDDEFIQALLAAYLEKEGFRLSLAASGKEMLAILGAETIDLILLDLGLPDEDGLALCRQVRARSGIPIIVVTARKGRADKITALEMGADDYLTKPFDPEELMLRARNLLRRGGGRDGAVKPDLIRFGGWLLDIAGHDLKDPAGGPVALTGAEFNLLAALAKAPGRVLGRGVLLDAIATDNEAPADRVIDVLISRLRKKIEPDPKRPSIIVTITGAGYKFNAKMG